MLAGVSSGVSVVGAIELIVAAVGAAATVGAWFWARLGQAQVELLKAGNEAQDRRITELESQLKQATDMRISQGAELKAAKDRIVVLERLVTGHEAIERHEAASERRHESLLAVIGSLRP